MAEALKRAGLHILRPIRRVRLTTCRWRGFQPPCCARPAKAAIDCYPAQFRSLRSPASHAIIRDSAARNRQGFVYRTLLAPDGRRGPRRERTAAPPAARGGRTMTDLKHPALTLLMHTRWDDALARLIDRSRSMIGANAADRLWRLP